MNSSENEGKLQFSTFLSQIEECLQKKLYYVATITSLTIPDIAGAIDSKDGRADRYKYVKWYDEYVKPKYTGKPIFSGEDCYSLRCSMLHQGKTKNENIEVVFMRFPQSNALGNPLLPYKIQEGVLSIEPHTFCMNMIYAAYDWLDAVHDNDLFKINIRKFMNLYSITFTFDSGPAASPLPE